MNTQNKRRLIMGTALGIAAIAATIDHTRHRLPKVEEAQSDYIILEEGESEAVSPCGLGQSPCSL